MRLLPERILETIYLLQRKPDRARSLALIGTQIQINVNWLTRW